MHNCVDARQPGGIEASKSDYRSRVGPTSEICPWERPLAFRRSRAVCGATEGRIRNRSLLAERRPEVSHVLLSLLKQRAQGLGNVGESQIHCLAESMSVALQLGLFEA